MARSKQLAPHIGRLSRSAVKARRGFHKGLKKSNVSAKPEPQLFKEVQVGGEKNGQNRLVPTQKAAAFYPAEDIRQPKKSRKTPQPTKLRGSITPGTVLILLAGRFRGKRVVFLKQLTSGLLLVTGPYAINGVPLRRVNQAYVIATSTKIELGDFKLDEKVNDSYFAKPAVPRSRDTESEFFTEGKPKAKDSYPEAKSSEQKTVDKVVVEAVKKTDNLGKYLKASWGLSKGQHPHQLAF
ncbi:60S ribosomal protein L6 [Ramaria rubella]|nr:60S ribosomal protein L6 [Ramaria rubella]